MKRILLIFAFSIAIISGCDKNMPEVASTNNNPCLRISSGFSETKVTHGIQDGLFKSQWEKGDTITVMINGDYRYYVADQSGETTTFSMSEEHQSGFSAWDGLTAYAITGKRSIKDGNYVLLNESMGNQTFSSSRIPMDCLISKAEVRNSAVSLLFSYPCSFLKMGVPKSTILSSGGQLVVEIIGDYPFLLSNNTATWVNDVTLVSNIFDPATMPSLDENNNWSAESILFPNLIMNLQGGRHLSYYDSGGTNYLRMDNTALYSFPDESLGNYQDSDIVPFYVAFCPEYRAVSLEEDRYLIRVYSKDNRTDPLYEKCAPIGNLKNNTVYDVNLTAKYTSQDYSKDGSSSAIYKATKGDGVDVVFMGEGYTDLDLEEGGVYERDMTAATDHLFSYSPLASYKDYFNVYSVKVVSPFYDASENDSPLNDVSIIRKYFNGVPEINTSVMRVVILKRFALDVLKNDDIESSTTEPSYTVNYFDNSFYIRMNHRYNYDRVLLHEFMHGIAKVGDEYYNESETIDDNTIQELQNLHSIGFYVNLDTIDDADNVIWSHLLKDERYNNEGLSLYTNNPDMQGKKEGLDIFEGGWLKYSTGIFRPSYYSLMNNNINGVWSEWMNAPTREALYKHIMQAAYGNEWVYDYESFVSFDQHYRELVMSYLGVSSRSVPSPVSNRPNKWNNHIAPIFDGESPANSKLTNDRIKQIILERKRSL